MNYIIPIIIAVITGIPGFYALWIQYKKDKVDIGSSLLKDALSLKDEIKEDKAELRTRFDNAILVYEDLLKSQKKDIDEQLSGIREVLLLAQNEIVLLKKSIKLLKKRVSYLRKGIDILICQIEELGESPAWRPDNIGEIEEELDD